jgi:hypothetical protein
MRVERSYKIVSGVLLDIQDWVVVWAMLLNFCVAARVFERIRNTVDSLHHSSTAQSGQHLPPCLVIDPLFSLVTRCVRQEGILCLIGLTSQRGLSQKG